MYTLINLSISNYLVVSWSFLEKMFLTTIFWKSKTFEDFGVFNPLLVTLGNNFALQSTITRIVWCLLTRARILKKFLSTEYLKLEHFNCFPGKKLNFKNAYSSWDLKKITLTKSLAYCRGASNTFHGIAKSSYIKVYYSR